MEPPRDGVTRPRASPAVATANGDTDSHRAFDALGDALGDDEPLKTAFSDKLFTKCSCAHCTCAAPELAPSCADPINRPKLSIGRALGKEVWESRVDPKG